MCVLCIDYKKPSWLSSEGGSSCVLMATVRLQVHLPDRHAHEPIHDYWI